MRDDRENDTARLRDYVLEAREHPALLAHHLRQVPLVALCRRLRCSEEAAHRMLICSVPSAEALDDDIELIAAYAGIDHTRLADLLSELGFIQGQGRPQRPHSDIA